MGLKINGSTSGSIEIDVPAVAGTDTSITIPATNGGEFIVSDSSGNIDLGPLDINGSASDDSVNIDSSGRLLVGETSSTQAGSIDAKAQVVSTDYNAALTLRRNQASDGAPGMLFCKSRGTSNSANVVVNSGDGLGNIRFFGADATGGNDFAEGAAISCVVDGTPGSNDMPGRLEFKTTADGASSPTERIRINSNGVFQTIDSTGYHYYLAKSGAGNTYVAHYISSAEGSGYTYNIFYRVSTNTGSIAYNGTGITYNTTSDYRLKENIVPISNAINRLQQLSPSRFNFIAETGFSCDCTIDGFIAHEVKDVVPEAVTGEKDAVNDDGSVKPQQLDQSKLVPLLTAALQEAIGKIEALETANASLEARLTALEGGAA